MDVFLLSVVSAFLLFAVLLPLAGILIGLFCYYVLPYAFVGVVTLCMLVLAGVKVLFAWWLGVLTLAWAATVWIVKRMFHRIGDSVEHHEAAQAALLLGAPYRRRKNALLQAAAES